ncbi:MAG: glycosyltransferase [Thermoanaerobaculia bacterium]
MLKSLLRRVPPVASAWSAVRRGQQHREYEERRERYAAATAERGLRYSEAATVAAVRARLAARGTTPARRTPGGIHTFAFVPGYSWHDELFPDLEELGRLTVFDYRREGFDWNDFARADRSGLAARAEMNERVLPALRAAQVVQPVDWVFVYASGIEISASTVKRIVDETGIPIVNMCLDDKQSWTGPFMGDHRGGQIDLAAAFDLSWTSARVACEWVLVEGGRPLYMPEGFDASRYHPLAFEKDLPVSFVGGAYGRRPRAIRWLRNRGVDVRTFGEGWRGAQPATNLCEIVNRSVLNLGMGEIGHSEVLTNVKGRDFQIPGAGGAYLTSFNSDLAQHFDVGREILCYKSDDEMLEQLRDWVSRPADAVEVGRRARRRALAEHRWLHRYRRVCEIVGILANAEAA